MGCGADRAVVSLYINKNMQDHGLFPGDLPRQPARRGRQGVRHAAEETARYQTLEGALACLIEDFSLSGIRANPDQPSLFHGHQS